VSTLQCILTPLMDLDISYARHVGARSMRNVRSNCYLLAAFLWYVQLCRVQSQSRRSIICEYLRCLVILARALSGAGYDPESINTASSNPSVLRRLRLRSQEGIEMGWERLGKCVCHRYQIRMVDPFIQGSPAWAFGRM
jgi:hypothetical protein